MNYSTNKTLDEIKYRLKRVRDHFPFQIGIKPEDREYTCVQKNLFLYRSLEGLKKKDPNIKEVTLMGTDKFNFREFYENNSKLRELLKK
ncbi:MAG: hypothetical protein PHE43_02175 [Candidatus Nanoarchaeia archaeon]|nr:hypothetical protein [Candidatus Nanoarchaeia archaeon]